MTSSNEEIFLFDFITQDELENEKHPNAFALNSIINEAKQSGKIVHYIQYSELGFYGLIAKIAKRATVRSDLSKKNYLSFMFTSSFYLFSAFFSQVDPFLKRKVADLLKSGKKHKSVIVAYPFLFSSFHKAICRVDNHIEVTLLEHNIEYNYLKFNMGGLSRVGVGELLLRTLKRIEMNAIYSADKILTVSLRDRAWILNTIPEKNINLIPDLKPGIDLKLSVPAVDSIPILMKFTSNCRKSNLFFVGTNYNLNYDVVKDLIKLSRILVDVENQINFFIVGNISRRFLHHKDLPKNVHFLGFIEDLSNLLCFADLFFLEDRMGTGYESKIYTYARFNKPIIILRDENAEPLRLKESQFIYEDSLDDLVHIIRLILKKRSSVEHATLFRIRNY